MLSYLASETTLIVTAGIIAVAALWSLIELTRAKAYRPLLWGIIPALVIAGVLSAVSVTAIKGLPTEKIPEGEWFLINMVAVENEGIYLWIIEQGMKEPRAIKLPFDKEVLKKIKGDEERAKKKGRPLKGKFNDRSKDPRLWEFDVESTLPKKTK